MSDTIISVERLSKRYRLGQIGATTLRESAERLWHRLRGRDPHEHMGKVGQLRKQTTENTETRRKPEGQASDSKGDAVNSTEGFPSNSQHASSPLRASVPSVVESSPSEDLWALRDVSFEVKRGEVLGIIGRNGAGKSTLLKILSRITEPTKGRAVLRGRVASLLEVGTGFHPELTGRENVYLNGAILGMKKAEIARKFDEIVAFSEVERFIDTPVKRYSSGMYVRLAFAVAAHLEPEILVVDEVLAVGDASFQKKCLGKMGDVAKQGRTILFVSHNMVAIKSLCSRSCLLREGALVADGPTETVTSTYLRNDSSEIVSQEWAESASAPGTSSFRFQAVKLQSRDTAEENHLTVQTHFDVSIHLQASRRGRINLSLHLQLITGELVLAVASPAIDVRVGMVKFTCHFPGNLLNDAFYNLSIMIVEDSQAHFILPEALRFEIHDIARTSNWLGKWPGVVRPQMQWDLAQL